MQSPEAFYRGRLDPEYPPHVRLGWLSAEGQQTNFRVLLDLAEQVGGPLRGLSVHDAGCGHGDLYPHLLARGVGPYIGTDFMAEPLVVAREQHPGVTFQRLDLLTDTPPTADVTLVCGTLAYHTPENVEKMLERLWRVTTHTLAFIAWWDFPRGRPDTAAVRDTQHRIEQFVRRHGSRRGRNTAYGVPNEAMLAIAR